MSSSGLKEVGDDERHIYLYCFCSSNIICLKNEMKKLRVIFTNFSIEQNKVENLKDIEIEHFLRHFL